MSYVELQYYKAHALEVREYGDTGWAVHVYPPRNGRLSKKIAVLRTNHPSELGQVLNRAQAAVDAGTAAFAALPDPG